MSMRRNSSSQKEAGGGHGNGIGRHSSSTRGLAGVLEDADFLGMEGYTYCLMLI
jgi:hypothetical protein